MPVHQCARVFNNPRLVNELSAISIANYLASTSTYVDLIDRNRQLTTSGVFYRTGIEKFINCYIYARFSGGWAQADAYNAENSMPHMGYVITYTGCTLL